VFLCSAVRIAFAAELCETFEDRDTSAHIADREGPRQKTWTGFCRQHSIVQQSRKKDLDLVSLPASVDSACALWLCFVARLEEPREIVS
jgi:hypothetical protein